jgi:hypothetical protein
MVLEAFFSTVASNVLTEIVKRIFGKKSLNEKEIEKIVESTIQKYHVAHQAPALQREIIMVLSNAGFVHAGGQALSPFHQIPEPSQLLKDWWGSKIYQIVSVYNEKALDVSEWNTDDGTPIVLWDYHGGANQQWKLIPVGSQSGLFKIHSQLSSKVVDVPWSTDNGTPIHQWSYHGGVNQQWHLLPIDGNGDIFKITSEYNGKSLDVPNTSIYDGMPLTQWDYHGGTNQQWRLMRIK